MPSILDACLMELDFRMEQLACEECGFCTISKKGCWCSRVKKAYKKGVEDGQKQASLARKNEELEERIKALEKHIGKG